MGGVPPVRIAPRHMAYPICGNCGSAIHIAHEWATLQALPITIRVRYWECDNCGAKLLIDDRLDDLAVVGGHYSSDSLDMDAAREVGWKGRAIMSAEVDA